MKAHINSRQPHATLDLASRRLKGRKIERLIKPPLSAEPLRVLEVGTGSGGISYYFANATSGHYRVEAVDVIDNRQNDEGYGFTLVSGVGLPFPDCSMDIVISNHVVEHVGGEDEQSMHLTELHRVMAPGGRAYLAVPNRWMLIEPHYNLMFLSWWPEQWRSAWLRLWRKGDHYDCRPLSRKQLESLLDKVNFRHEQLHGEALLALFEIERPHSLATKVVQRIPLAAWRGLRGLFPTLIYRLHRK